MSSAAENPTVVLPADRSFGLLFASIFGAAGLYGLWRGWSIAASALCFAAAALFLAAALTRPEVLRPLNRAWMQFGELLGRVITPLTLGIMFFLLITPVAVVARWLGRDELRLNPRQTESYWIDRAADAAPGQSFKNQF